MTPTAHPHGLSSSGLPPFPKISPLYNSSLSMGASFQTHQPVRNISKAQWYTWMVILQSKVIHETEKMEQKISEDQNSDLT